MPTNLDKATLEAALLGYQQQLGEIQAKMADIRRQIGGVAPAAQPKHRKVTPRKQKHHMSAEGRARIAAAQRARWAKAKRA